jgi:hypothetical protein
MLTDSKLCCDAFSKAMTNGTDNEAWGAAIHLDQEGAHYKIGLGLPPLRFCPWCGSDSNQTSQDIPE